MVVVVGISSTFGIIQLGYRPALDCRLFQFFRELAAGKPMLWHPNRVLAAAMIEYLIPPLHRSLEIRMKYGLCDPFAVQPVHGNTTRFH